MKESALTLYILSCSLFLFAQDYAVDWGPTYEKEGGMWSFQYLLGGDENHYYMIARPKKKSNFYKFNYKHELEQITPLDFTSSGKKLRVRSVLNFKHKNYASLYLYEKKQKLTVHFVSEIDREGNTHQPKRVGYLHTGGDMIISPNEELVLYYDYGSVKSKKTDPQMVNCMVFNEHYDKQWEKNFELPYENGDISIKQIFLDNDGNIYLSTWHYHEKEEKSKELPGYDYKLLKLTESGITELDVFLGNGRAPTDAGIFLGEDDYIYFGGFYTNETKKRIGAQGIFIVKISVASGKTVITNTEEFSEAFMKDLTSIKNIKKDIGLTNYDIKNFVLFADGSFSFVAEENYTTTHTITTSGGIKYVIADYHSNEIIVPRFSDKGEVLWVTPIEKSYVSQSYLYTSYVVGVANNKLYFVFNDTKSREEIKDKGKKGKDAIYTDISVLDANGKEVTRQILFSSNEIETTFIARLSEQVKPDRIILYGQWPNKYQFGHVVLK